MNSEIVQQKSISESQNDKGERMKMMIKKPLCLLLAFLLAFTFVSCSDSTPDGVTPEMKEAIERSNKLWIAGTITSLPSNVSAFPLLFPELYRNIEFDPDDPTQRAITKTISGKSGDLYFTALVSPSAEDADEKIPYTQAEIHGFALFGGEPGHMEAWGVTFGQTQDEAENAMAEYYDTESLYGEKTLPVGLPDDNPDLSYDVLSALRVKDASEVTPLKYQFNDAVLRLYYVDDVVCGIGLSMGSFT